MITTMTGDERPQAARADPRERIALSPRPSTVRYINQMVALGLFGTDPTAVATRLVEDGIRRALAEGILDKERDL